MVFAGYFPGGPPFPCITKLFAELSLPWEAKEYYRTQFHLNTTVTQINTSNLSPRYSQKAVQLAKVQPSDAVYLALPTSRIQSTVVFPPKSCRRFEPHASRSPHGRSGQGRICRRCERRAGDFPSHFGVMWIGGLSGSW